MKAFLSHNSFDKDFVEKVYEELGGAKAIYDVKSFENNSDLVYEIRHKMKEAGIYVLFLSKASLESGWVNDEIDFAKELKSNSFLKQVLVFQLDDTGWSNLNEWLRRYVVNALPSPKAVAARILSELEKHESTIDIGCLGREADEKKISQLIWNSNEVPPYIFMSGPDGIGRKTLIKKIYDNLYSGILINNMTVVLDDYFDLSDLYRQLLDFSSNWRVSDYINQMNIFTELSDNDKINKISLLIKKITVDYKQAMIIDLSSSVYTSADEVNPYLLKLMDSLKGYDYPYVIFISKRGISAKFDSCGVYYALTQLSKPDSEYLFNMLLHKNNITIPSKADKLTFIETVSGHPGLINHVIMYLKKNPHYRPSKTNKNIMQLVRDQLEKMVADLIGDDSSPREVIGLFGSANIISYEEMELLCTEWSIFENAFYTLLDAGFIIITDGYYKLPIYLNRLSSDYAEEHSSELLAVQKILLNSIEGIDDKDFVLLPLLDSRIIEKLTLGGELSILEKSFVMPVQQLKASKRQYDKKKYESALELAKEAYSQASKLSDDGVLECWRIIGQAAARLDNYDDYQFFIEEYKRVKKTDRTMILYFFVQGFYHRLNGDINAAKKNLERIIGMSSRDIPVYREMAYIHSFEGEYQKAIEYTNKAIEFIEYNPYILDIKAWALLSLYKETTNKYLLGQIDLCLGNLKIADKRSDTTFHIVRDTMYDVYINGSNQTLNDTYSNRRNLSAQLKISLLELLSQKDKHTQYDTLYNELSSSGRKIRNKLIEIDLARVHIAYLAYASRIPEAEEMLEKYKARFTDIGISKLLRIIRDSKAYAAKNQ